MALAALPFIVAFLVCADHVVDDLQHRLRLRRERRTLQRLDQLIGTHSIPLAALDDRRQPPIQQIAADLRRLDRQRLGVASQSKVWHAAVQQAYDDRLRLASQCLGVAEHLAQLDGVDLAIERVRVEGELQAAGLALR
ncbi:hypothetical protein WEI85_42470 [Actinomycetes bacterium KLBMP 9797]